MKGVHARFEPGTLKPRQELSFFAARPLGFTPRVHREWKQESFALLMAFGVYQLRFWLMASKSDVLPFASRQSDDKRDSEENLDGPTSRILPKLMALLGCERK